jgi:hypothetical protein
MPGIILFYAGQHNYAAQKNNYTHSKQRYAQNPACARSPKGKRNKDKEINQRNRCSFQNEHGMISYFEISEDGQILQTWDIFRPKLNQ